MSKLMTFLIAILILASASNTLGGLTLCSENYPYAINIKCDQLNSKAPIPRSRISEKACANMLGQTNLTWSSIKTEILGGKTSAVCVFSSFEPITRVILTVSNDNLSGKISDIQYDSSKFSIEITPYRNRNAEQMILLIKPRQSITSKQKSN